MKLGNLKIKLNKWEKYGKCRVYVRASRSDGSKLPGRGYDGGYFDADGYHAGNGGWVDSQKYHNPKEWAAIEGAAKEMLNNG